MMTTRLDRLNRQIEAYLDIFMICVSKGIV